MNRETLQKLVTLGERVGFLFIVTADEHGVPHLAIAKNFHVASDDEISLTDWICPTTAANLAVNLHVSCIAWDARTDLGFQATGVVQHDEAISNGEDFEPESELGPVMPQVKTERMLTVRIDTVVAFTAEVHSDEPDEE